MMNTTKTKKTQAIMVMAGICGATSMASANLAISDDPGIFSPCEGAHAEIIWMGSDAGYTGELNWINRLESNSSVTMFNNHAATVGQRYALPGTFALGERLDFSYQVIRGGLDFFSTENEADWSQFSVDASDPENVFVMIEDIRRPGGDGDYNDAMFRVEFTCETLVPAPGSFALLGLGGLVIGTRRR